MLTPGIIIICRSDRERRAERSRIYIIYPSINHTNLFFYLTPLPKMSGYESTINYQILTINNPWDHKCLPLAGSVPWSEIVELVIARALCKYFYTEFILLKIEMLKRSNRRTIKVIATIRKSVDSFFFLLRSNKTLFNLYPAT